MVRRAIIRDNAVMFLIEALWSGGVWLGLGRVGAGMLGAGCWFRVIKETNVCFDFWIGFVERKCN